MSEAFQLSVHEEPVLVEVSAVKPGPGLRLGGVNRDHVEALAGSDGKWPPILVTRADHTIVDGYYRYLAARELGHTHIEVEYFQGGVESALLEALRRNLHHGLPLSLRDREAAARRVLVLHPNWSDRRLGKACGLAPGTVARLRTALGCSGEESGHLNARLGADGKRHPADRRASRERIRNVIRERPDGSLRSIARLAGSSPATVAAMKAELGEGHAELGTQSTKRVAASTPLKEVAADEALLSTEEGKRFVKWFTRTTIGDEWAALAYSIPISRAYEIVDESRRRAQRWHDFATILEERTAGQARRSCM